MQVAFSSLRWGVALPVRMRADSERIGWLERYGLRLAQDEGLRGVRDVDYSTSRRKAEG